MVFTGMTLETRDFLRILQKPMQECLCLCQSVSVSDSLSLSLALALALEALHRVPCTLYPTLHPVPYALHPTLEILYPRP